MSSGGDLGTAINADQADLVPEPIMERSADLVLETVQQTKDIQNPMILEPSTVSLRCNLDILWHLTWSTAGSVSGTKRLWQQLGNTLHTELVPFSGLT